MDRADVRPLAALTAGFAGAYVLYGLFRHWSFGTSYDLGIFDQVVWHLSRFERPSSSLVGIPNIFGDHFHPIIILFVPLYWIVAAPETLIVAQAALFAASIVPVFLFLKTRLPRAAAYLVAVAYGLFWGIQQAMAFDVHELAFAPLVIATAVLAMDTRRWRLFTAMAILLMCIKEDLIPLVGGFGVYLVLQGERRRGVAMVAVSVVALWLVVGMVIPALGESGRSQYMQIVDDVVAHPASVFSVAVTPVTKVRTIVLWLLPFLFLPLASPLGLLLPTVALSRLLSFSPNHWGTSFHYSAPLAPLLAMSAGDALARLHRRLARGGRPSLTPVVTVAAVMVLLSAFLPGHLPLWRILSARHYRTPAAAAPARDALALIPRDASVLAQAAVVPHLSQRNTILVLGRAAPETGFVIAAEGLSPWPSTGVDELRRLLEEKRQRGYRTIFERDGWVVLQGPEVSSR